MEEGIRSIQEDYSYQKAGWPAQTIFWILMGGVLLWGLLGGLGDGAGVLSQANSIQDNSVVSYASRMRVEKPASLTIQFVQADGAISVSFPQQYLRNVTITQITPEPDFSELIHDRIVYHFRGRGKGLTIIFSQLPKATGSHTVELLANREAHTVSHFVFF